MRQLKYKSGPEFLAKLLQEFCEEARQEGRIEATRNCLEICRGHELRVNQQLSIARYLNELCTDEGGGDGS